MQAASLGRTSSGTLSKLSPASGKATSPVAKGAAPPGKAAPPVCKGSPPKASPPPPGKGSPPKASPGKGSPPGKGFSPPGKAPLGKGAPPGKGPPPGKAPAGLPPKLGLRPGLGLPQSAVNSARSQQADEEDAKGPRLRPLFWTLAKSVEPESVWASIGKPVHFDRAEFERKFAMAAPRANAPGTAPGTPAAGTRGLRDGGDASGDARKRVRVLDDRTSRLLEIAFRKLPPPRELARIVDCMENFPEGLATEAVLALHGAAVEQQEAVDQIRQLAAMETDMAQLDLPERYLWVLGHVPFCTAKLACGALLVGPALEIGDFRRSSERVISCCQALRGSELLRKCLCTSLAVGNLLNRGTTRASAQGVVLPESLLKLDELRGERETEEPDARGPSVLEFVAQALADDSPGGGPAEETDRLLAKVRGAQSVPLEEAEGSCRKVVNQAQKAHQGLAEVHDKTPGCRQMVERVRKVCEEAELALKLVLQAKEEQARTLQWSSTRDTKVKSSDWFALWGQFLDQLKHAIGRARVPPPQPPPNRPPPSLAGSGSPKHPPLSTPSKPEVRAPARPSGAAETGDSGDSSTLTGLTPLYRQAEPVVEAMQAPTQPPALPTQLPAVPAQPPASMPPAKPQTSAQPQAADRKQMRKTLVRRLDGLNEEVRDDEQNSDVSEWSATEPQASVAPPAPLLLPCEHASAVQSPASSRNRTPPTPKHTLVFTPPQTPVVPPPAVPAKPLGMSDQSLKQRGDDVPSSVTRRRPQKPLWSARRQTGTGGG